MKEINLNHICKIEGHAHLNLKIEKNKVKKCQLKASEGARFFEALVIGKKLADAQEIVSRICGICSSAHTVACVQALEEALGVYPTKQQQTIRDLLMISERIRSHITHLYFLSLPDYYGKESALELGPIHKNKINTAISLITLGNHLIEIFGGREIHPFLEIKEEFPEINKKEIINQLTNSKPLIIETIKLFSSLPIKDLKRKTDYLSLHREDKYATINGKVKSYTEEIIDDEYKKHIKENIKEYATSKFALHHEKTYQVGAIARINNNLNQLDNETKKIIKQLKINLPFDNPFQNNLAQALELLHLINRSIKLIQNFPTIQETKPLKIKAGIGISAVEAPRGTLFHEYKIDNQGIITYCNIITPTVQNLNMMESDITLLVNNLLQQDNSKKEIILEVEKLIRAYDPCFSCSTHFLKVNWE